MIFLFIFFLSFLPYYFINKLSHEETDIRIMLKIIFSIGWGIPHLLILHNSITTIIQDIEITNGYKAANIHMMPADLLQSNYDTIKEELEAVKKQIKATADKNKFQVEIKSLAGIKIYAMPLSAAGTSFQGLGDIERGGAEKLKLLNELIDKQEQISNRLIEAKKLLAREDYYTRNASIMVYENSAFDGILVRWLSIKGDQEAKVVENQIYYPKTKEDQEKNQK